MRNPAGRGVLVELGHLHAAAQAAKQARHKAQPSSYMPCWMLQRQPRSPPQPRCAVALGSDEALPQPPSPGRMVMTRSDGVAMAAAVTAAAAEENALAVMVMRTGDAVGDAV